MSLTLRRLSERTISKWTTGPVRPRKMKAYPRNTQWYSRPLSIRMKKLKPATISKWTSGQTSMPEEEEEEEDASSERALLWIQVQVQRETSNETLKVLDWRFCCLTA